MLEIVLEGIFHSCFTFSIPTWVVIIAVIFACWLIYWDKSFSKLKVKGKPMCVDATHDSLEISWEKPLFANPENYRIYYKEAHAQENWKPISTSNKSCTIIIDGLSPSTKYKVKVSACHGTEVGPSGEESDAISTKSLGFKMKLNSTLTNGSTPGLIPKYAVPYTEERNEDMKVQTFKIGEDDGQLPNTERKSILLISSQHSGKRTFVEGIMNYMFGVTFNDNYRLCLTLDGSDEINKDWIKVYQFDEYERGRIGFPLSIIDMPRCCSSENGNENQIYEQLDFVLNAICENINLLCLVNKFSDFDLPAEQLQYLRSIANFFVDDFMADFCVFYTFADAGESHIEEILQESELMPAKSFQVNWSSLFRTSHRYSPLFWQMNSHNLQIFFDFMTQSSANGIRREKELSTPEKPQDLENDTASIEPEITPAKLQELRNDIASRQPEITPAKLEELKNDIASLQPEITKDLSEIGEIKDQISTFKKHKDEIMSNGDISFKIEEIRQIKTNLTPGVHVTNCMHCFYTCHKNCGIPDDDGKKNCSAMDSDGYCMECTSNCIWSIHKNTPYIYEYKKVEVTKSYKEMKLNYEKEKGKELTYDEYLENLNSDIQELLERLHGKVQKMAECQNEMQGIEHSPIARSVGDTIDDLIESEKRKQERGFEKRIEMYEELKNYSKMVKISRVQN